MKKLFCFVCACLMAFSTYADEINNYDALYENLPFKMEKVDETTPAFRNIDISHVINRTDGVKLENIKVSAKTHTFDAKNSKNVTVNGKTYKKIDDKGITLDF